MKTLTKFLFTVTLFIFAVANISAQAIYDKFKIKSGNNKEVIEYRVISISPNEVEVNFNETGALKIHDTMTIPKTVSYKGKTFTVTGIYDADDGYYSKVSHLIIPETVKKIYYRAFDRSCNLISISVDANNKYYTSVDGVLFNKDKTEMIKYPSCKSSTSYAVPPTVKDITSGGIFYKCKYLTQITIPASVNYFSAYSSMYNYKLEYINVDENNKYFSSINGVLFEKDENKNKTKLIKYPSGKTNTSYSIPSSVTGISYYCFTNNNLEEINIPASFNNYTGGVIFEKNDKLKSINVDENNKYYSSINGVLFNKDKTEILKYPEYKTDKSYSIPSSVTKIKNICFENLYFLTQITIPSSVTKIETRSFSNCKKLQTVFSHIDTDICKGLVSDSFFSDFLNPNYFDFRKKIKLYVPKGTLKEYQDCENWCNYATKKEGLLPKENVEEMDLKIGERFEDKGIFYEITSKDPYKVKIVENSITEYKGEINIPEKVKRNGDEYFVTEIENNIFNSDKLQAINVSVNNNYYSSLKGVLFNKNGNVLIKYPSAKLGTDYVVPHGVSNIKSRAFEKNKNLIKIILPSSLTLIEEFAFSSSEELSIIVSNIETNIANVLQNGNVFDNIKVEKSKRKLYIPQDKGAYYKSSSKWISYADKNNMFESGESLNIGNTFIENDITYKVISELPTVEVIEKKEKYTGYLNILPKVSHNGKQYSVTSIGENAFKNCESLTQITIPESVTRIGKNAFYGCTSLTQITIPKAVTRIGKYAFDGCTSLTQINIPKAVTEIGSGVFSNCKSLTQITIPEAVTRIENFTFDGCEALTQVILPESITSIGEYAFRNCEALTQINIPESVTRIGHQAFRNCKSLTQITIPEAVTSIESTVFWNCKSLAQITIPKTVTSIGDSAFEGCHSLIQINIPESVTSIGSYAFKDCISLIQINIPESVTEIGSGVFYNCEYLTQITIPKSVTNMGYEIFYGCKELATITSYIDKDEIIKFIVEHTYYDMFSNINVKNEDRTLYVPKGKVEVYKKSEWKNFTDNIKEMSSLSISPSEEIKGIKIYPNPLVNELHINHNEIIDNIFVYDIIGKQHIKLQPKTSTLTVPFLGLPKGVYLVKIESNHKTKVARIIKN